MSELCPYPAAVSQLRRVIRGIAASACRDSDTHLLAWLNLPVELEGGGTVHLKRRERPQLLLRNGTPAVLYNGAMPTEGLPFTWAQALGGPAY